MSDFRAVPRLYRQPVVFGTLPEIPRPERLCAVCGTPLPAVRPPNQIVHKGACAKVQERKRMRKAIARRSKQRTVKGNL